MFVPSSSSEQLVLDYSSVVVPPTRPRLRLLPSFRLAFRTPQKAGYKAAQQVCALLLFLFHLNLVQMIQANPERLLRGRQLGLRRP